ncbi:hypothetical protein FRC08_012907 [Ceratobasidium sp. 394]|nr:hypothetical protein FRC08_012907 [Ceratobasidium sp. 394]
MVSCKAKSRNLVLAIVFGAWGSSPVAAFPTPSDVRANTTGHLIFNTVSSLLQHWPNTIYRNGHTFVPATIPAGTLLHHSRTSHDPPPSPEFFAFDLEHSYIFCFWAPCVMFNYAANRDLRVGYFDGTSASTLAGPRDFQDILFNGRFVPDGEYNPWVHAGINMCDWASKIGLDGIIRMEPSFEAILCNINADLSLISKLELVYPESIFSPDTLGPNFGTAGLQLNILHPRHLQQQPYFPPPTMPVRPPPPGWKGKQRNHPEIAFESVRAGMWHNRSPGESRIILDYAGIVSAYDETYTSLVTSRQMVPRSKHRLGNISVDDRELLKAEVHDVLTREHFPAKVNWQSLFQAVVDRYAERLEDLRYLLRRTDPNPAELAATTRHKVLIMLAPYMVLPQANSGRTRESSAPHDLFQQSTLSAKSARSEPDDDWFERIYGACAGYATAGVRHKGDLTTQEQRLLASVNRVQSAICSSLTHIWSTAFDSEDKPVFAGRMVAAWLAEVEELMDWLDWHMWVKCDPPCGAGTQCVLTTWPWEVRTGEEDIGPTCRDKLLLY